MAILLPGKPALLLHMNSPEECKRGGGQYQGVNGKFGYGVTNKVYINDPSLPINENMDQVCSYWQYQIYYPYEVFKISIGKNGNNGNRYNFEGMLFHNPANSWWTYNMICTFAWTKNGPYNTKLKPAIDNNTWVHYEADYIASSKRILFFRNGSKIYDKTSSIASLNTSIAIFNDDDAKGYISEVLWAPYVLHTKNFTPPTEPYMWPETHYTFDQKQIYCR